jgi:hypothetical protein
MKEFFLAETVTGERVVEHVGRCMLVCVKCVLNVLMVEVRTPLQQKGWLNPVMSDSRGFNSNLRSSSSINLLDYVDEAAVRVF